MLRIAVCNVACDHWYPKGQDRLAASLSRHWPEAERFFWRDQVPEGALTHAERPYNYKTWACEAAADAGADVVVWLDCSMWLTRRPEALLRNAEQHGAAVHHCGWTVGDWSTDRSLRVMGLTRDEAFQMPMCLSGVVAFDLRTLPGRSVLAAWHRWSCTPGVFEGPWKNDGAISADARVLGHRHDQTALSVEIHRHRVPIQGGPESGFAYWSPEAEADPRVAIVARGM